MTNGNWGLMRSVQSAAEIVGLCASMALGFAQDDRDRDRGHDRVTRIEPGTTIVVRTNQPIDSDRGDNRAYTATVDQDVRGGNGRLAIPRGSQVELIVRVARDNDLILDLDSVTVNGQRYGVETAANRVESSGDRRDQGLVGAIVGAIQGGQVRGREVRVPRGSVVTFRVDRPMIMGVAHHSYDRDGNHYHGDRDRDH
jgi:hypothetical protein